MISRRFTGMRELIGDGTMADIPTCVYGERIEDAEVFADKAVADRFAAIVGGKTIKVRVTSGGKTREGSERYLQRVGML